MLVLSSPYVASGLAYDLHRKRFGKDSDVLIWQSPGYVLHPGLSEAALARIRDIDPEGAGAEIEGRFSVSVAALLDDDALQAAVDDGVTVREPVKSRECSTSGSWTWPPARKRAMTVGLWRSLVGRTCVPPVGAISRRRGAGICTPVASGRTVSVSKKA